MRFSKLAISGVARTLGFSVFQSTGPGVAQAENASAAQMTSLESTLFL